MKVIKSNSKTQYNFCGGTEYKDALKKRFKIRKSFLVQEPKVENVKTNLSKNETKVDPKMQACIDERKSEGFPDFLAKRACR